jgi:hypothetical protein
MAWKYIYVLNSCLQILCTISLGAILSKLAPDVFDNVFVSKSVQFVFYVALPCHIAYGIGVNVDFYSNAFVWEYICCFLVLRVLSLLLAALSVFVQNKHQISIGDIAVRWLTLTWISTVILGVPIMTSVYGSPQKGQFYGLLAGISSFIFQLPFQIFFFECHELGRDHTLTQEKSVRNQLDDDIENESDVIDRIQTDQKHILVGEASSSRTTGLFSFTNWPLWKDIGLRVLKNPVIWGISAGFLMSLSKFGKIYLKSSSDRYVISLQFVPDFMSWFGGCVSPVSLFSMGVWMQLQGRNLVAISFKELTLFMFSKLFLVPFIMIGLTKAFRL